MKTSTKWLIGFGSAIGALVILAVILVMTLPGSTPLPPADTPEGTVMRYFEALREKDYETAYTFLSESALSANEWMDTFDEWVGSKGYYGQTDAVWRVRIMESEGFPSYALITLEISSFEPNASFSRSVDSYRQVYRVEKTGSGWKIREPLEIPWPVR